MLTPASEPGTLLLADLGTTCWPWDFNAAGGRARADGLVGVCGIGRALCTGLGLGSPDFMFVATRMAGIFFPAAWWPQSPLPVSLRGKSFYESLVFDFYISWCSSVNLTVILVQKTHEASTCILALEWIEMWMSESWLSAGLGAELHNIHWRSHQEDARNQELFTSETKKMIEEKSHLLHSKANASFNGFPALCGALIGWSSGKAQRTFSPTELHSSHCCFMMTEGKARAPSMRAEENGSKQQAPRKKEKGSSDTTQRPFAWASAQPVRVQPENTVHSAASLCLSLPLSPPLVSHG